MLDDLVKDNLQGMMECIELIEERFLEIDQADDFVLTGDGVLILDSICMRLQVIGELSKNIDKIDRSLFERHPEIEWPKIMKLRDIISHHYEHVDHEIIHGICVDSKENIAANKLSAISGRKMTKDFFDLLFLLREIEFTDAVRYSEYKDVPLDYEGIMLAVGDILSSPSGLEGEILTDLEVDETEFRTFVKDLIERLIIHAKSQ